MRFGLLAFQVRATASWTRRLPGDRWDQRAWLDADSTGKSDNRLELGGALAVLEQPDLGPVHGAAIGQFLLREAGFLACLGQRLSKCSRYPIGAVVHRGIVASMQTPVYRTYAGVPRLHQRRQIGLTGRKG